MLHIVRKKGDAIVIDGNITIRIMEVSGHQVRLGIEAPRSIGVYRAEIVERVRNENAAALASTETLDAINLQGKES